jgi:hypothetical protein
MRIEKFLSQPISAKHSINHLESRLHKVFKAVIFTDGRISLRAQGRDAFLKNRVYVIYNRKTGQRYVGRSSQEFNRRLSQHAYLANNCKASRAQAALYHAIRKDPKNIFFGILKSSKLSFSKLVDQEIQEIKQTPQQLRLNQQIGGGGVSADPLMSPVKKKPVFYPTPEKRYGLKQYESGIKAVITPSTSDLKGCVYQIKDESTGKRYVGMTSQSFGTRISQHMSLTHKESDEISRQKIYDDIKRRPSDFTCGILASNVSRADLPVVESLYIHKKDAFETGYNCNRGGGGCVSSQSN